MGNQYTSDKDNTSVLNYIYYLRSYKYYLEDYLKRDMKEIYVQYAERCFYVPLEYHEKEKLLTEIQNINLRLVEYDRWNKTAGECRDDSHETSERD